MAFFAGFPGNEERYGEISQAIKLYLERNSAQLSKYPEAAACWSQNDIEVVGLSL